MNSEKEQIESYIACLFRFRLRTENEVKYRCEEKGFEVELTACVIEEMKARKIIDDERFVSMYLYEGVTLKKKGFYVLVQELYRLGIEKESVSRKWKEIEKQLDLPALLEGWFQKEKNPDKRKWREKMSRRGFEYDQIDLVLRNERTQTE